MWALGQAGKEGQLPESAWRKASASLPRGRELQGPWGLALAGGVTFTRSPRSLCLSQKVAYAITPEKEHELVDGGEVRQFTVSEHPLSPRPGRRQSITGKLGG